MGMGTRGLWCDTDGCISHFHYVVTHNDDWTASCLSQAQSAGWITLIGADGAHLYYCPTCARKREQSGPEYYLLPQSCTEVRHVIEALNLGYNLGNVLKYVCRAGKKPGANYADDLRKAAQYIQFELERVERANPGAQEP